MQAENASATSPCLASHFWHRTARSHNSTHDIGIGYSPDISHCLRRKAVGKKLAKVALEHLLLKAPR
jgi:hypothetical protein